MPHLIALSFVFLLMASTSHAAWIGLCNAVRQDADARVLRTFKRPSGESATLIVAPARIAGCDMREIAVGVQEVRWATVMTGTVARQLQGGVILKAPADSENAPEIIALREERRTPATASPPAPAPTGSATTNRNARRSMWAWNPQLWQERAGALLDVLQKNAAGLVFISVPLATDTAAVEAPEALSRFITQAHAGGIAVWAVIGDPAHVLPAERAQAEKHARAYAAYNASAPPQAQLGGLQLDIEPYLNAGYDLDVEGWLSAYVETVRGVRAATTLAIDVAVPFWWGQQRFRDTTLLEALTPLVDFVSVMNYRTDRKQIIELARPFLDWGNRRNRKVRLALEAGPIPDEVMRTFRPGSSGTLWTVPLQQQTVLLELREARANRSGETYAYSHTTPWHGRSTTFRDNISGLLQIVPELEKHWSTHPAFAGIALHGLDPE